MTYYLGSKAEHADELLKIMLPYRKSRMAWVEPFVGGANVICRVPDGNGPRIGADINPYMVALHTALGNGWNPPENVDEALYNKIKKNPTKYPPELVGFVGTGCAFGAMWFSTYARNEKGTNYAAQSRRVALRDAVGMKGATFIHSSYDQLEIPPNSLLYLDPPYSNTTGYLGANQKIVIGESLNKNDWNAKKFWQWADRMVDQGHTVFVSEYKGPQAEAYPTPPRTEAHNATMAELRQLQADMQALGDAPTPPDMATKREALATALAGHERVRRAPCEALAARWKVVWEKEVKVNFAAVSVDVEAGGEAKTETEKLFHREA
jgi:DNA adenine methylase